jgi:hypothetical protein
MSSNQPLHPPRKSAQCVAMTARCGIDFLSHFGFLARQQIG